MNQMATNHSNLKSLWLSWTRARHLHRCYSCQYYIIWCFCLMLEVPVDLKDHVSKYSWLLKKQWRFGRCQLTPNQKPTYKLSQSYVYADLQPLMETLYADHYFEFFLSESLQNFLSRNIQINVGKGVSSSCAHILGGRINW